MQKNKIKILTLTNFVLILLVIFFLMYDKVFKQEQFVYVDKQKLFDNFQMTKDLKIIGDKNFKTKKAILDSLYLKLQEELPYVEKENTMKLFVTKRDELDQFNQTFAINETQKIWNRINSYIDSYSEEKKYILVLGSDSNDEILYANKKIDRTSELTEYINKKYEGFK